MINKKLTDEQLSEALIGLVRNSKFYATQPWDADQNVARIMLLASEAIQELQQYRRAPQAVRDVIAERQRQVTTEGWTPDHDDEHSEGQLADAAAAYAYFSHGVDKDCYVPVMWPWKSEWWKPTTTRRDLVKAGALILAEIERIDRAADGTRAGIY